MVGEREARGDGDETNSNFNKGPFLDSWSVRRRIVTQSGNGTYTCTTRHFILKKTNIVARIPETIHFDTEVGLETAAFRILGIREDP